MTLTHVALHLAALAVPFVSCSAPAGGAAAQGAPPTGAAQHPDRIDAESTRQIQEYTTDPGFLTAWVDHVPESDTVPSPRDFHGYVIGTPGILTRPDDIVAYFRELERTSPRVKLFSMGRSHGGREMILAAVADEAVLARIPQIKEANRRLADPRTTTEEQARALAAATPVTYCMTAGLHSPETGPPEMVQELAYRLAVSEQEHVREIRANVLTLIVPVLEMDGRARQVDWYYRHLTEVTDLEDTPPRSPPYWGDYTFHDNNRDGLQQSQPLTRNYTDSYHEWLPPVSLDLHESVPLLYVSTGTGPYNETVDPITITEWQWMASWDVSVATQMGLRGVWSWGFYTGWYPGYLLWVTNNHNAAGRFYETYGNSLAGTFERDLRRSTYADRRVNSREWYRAWPPEQELTWSLRNNTNYMQTGVLASLQLAARNGDTLLFNFWRKGMNSLEKGRGEAPYAFHVPWTQRNQGALDYLIELLGRHRIELHRAPEPIELEGAQIAKGDLVVRMDQPYRNFAKTLLTRQEFPRAAEHDPYDDIAWSLDLMLGLEVNAVDDPTVLERELEGLDHPTRTGGGVIGEEDGPWVVDHAGQGSLATLCWRLEEADVRALSEPLGEHPVGSLVISGVERDGLVEELSSASLLARPLPGGVPASAVEVNLPRVALFHTWTYTQDSGWARYALEQLGIPYELIDKDDLRAGDLGQFFDVILVPNTGGDLARIVQGVDTRWSPLAYTQTDEFPSHGVIDASADITGGMGFEGLGHLQDFVEGGGLLLLLGNSGVLAADSGIARIVRSRPSAGTPGSHITAAVLRPEHPIAWGYEEVTHVFHGNTRRYSVPDFWRGTCVMQYGTTTAAEAERAADKKAGVPVEAAAPKPEGADEGAPKPPLCLSGLVRDPDALERVPAVLDVPVGEGRVVFFSWNPLHRYQNHHDFAFVTNALLFHDDFPGTPTEQEMRQREE